MSVRHGFDLTAQTGAYAVCRLSPGDPVEAWMFAGPHAFIARTPEELSVVVSEASVPEGVRNERHFRLLRVDGTLDFAMTGVVASLVEPLARARISVLSVATFDTDYILVRESEFARAVEALRAAGHHVRGGGA